MKGLQKFIALGACVLALGMFGCAKQELVKDAPMVKSQTQIDEEARRAAAARGVQDVAVQQDNVKAVESLSSANAAQNIPGFKLNTVYFDYHWLSVKLAYFQCVFTAHYNRSSFIDNDYHLD